MAKPHSGGTALMITVTPTPGKYALFSHAHSSYAIAGIKQPRIIVTNCTISKNFECASHVLLSRDVKRLNAGMKNIYSQQKIKHQMITNCKLIS